MRRAATGLSDYAWAGAATGVAWLVSMLLAPVIDPHYFPFFCFAIALTAWAGGARPAVAALFLSVVALADLLPPPHSLAIWSPKDAIGLVAFLIIAAPLIWLIDTLRAARDALAGQVAQQDRDLAAAERALEFTLFERAQWETERAQHAHLIADRLAARALLQELRTRLAHTVTPAAVVAEHPDVPRDLRAVVHQTWQEAVAASAVLEQLERATRLDAHAWGPAGPPALDRAVNGLQAPEPPTPAHGAGSAGGRPWWQRWTG